MTLAHYSFIQPDGSKTRVKLSKIRAIAYSTSLPQKHLGHVISRSAATRNLWLQGILGSNGEDFSLLSSLEMTYGGGAQLQRFSMRSPYLKSMVSAKSIRLWYTLLMTEWQFIEEGDNFPDPLPEKPPHPERQLSWRWVWLTFGAAILVIGVGLMTLQGRRADRQAVIRADLTATVFEEEARRSIEGPVAISFVADSPPAWREAYRRSFQINSPNVSVNDIKITTLDFDGDCATVALDLDSLPQIRTYCLSAEGWQRAPVPPEIWGFEMDVLFLENGTELHFFPRDRAFAETLAQDLSSSFKALAQRRLWAGAIDQTARLQIKISPQDLHGPIISVAERRVVLNSPWLTPYQDDNGLASEAAVRLALGEILLGQATPAVFQKINLPGAFRFREATQTVLAMDLLLTPTEQARVIDHWRAQLGSHWVTPFLTELIPEYSPSLAQQAKWTARLTTHHIYTQAGPAPLFSIIQQLPITISWDHLFQNIIERPTYLLEREAAAYAQGNSPVSAVSFGLTKLSSPPKFPLSGTILQLDHPLENEPRTYLKLSDPAQLLALDLSLNLPIQTPEGDPLPSGCLGPEAQVAVSGEWLEVGQRLQATTITLQHPALLTIGPAPPNTEAYLLAGEFYNPDAFVALDQQGNLHPLTPLNETVQIFPLPVTDQKTTDFLFKFDLPTCGGAWFAHYEPRGGITQYWLMPFPLAGWTWRTEQQDLILLGRREDQPGYNIYQSTVDSLLPTLVGGSPLTQTLLGWHTAKEQLISLVAQPEGGRHLGLLDVSSGAEVSSFAYYLPLRGRRVSPNGEWLAYLVSSATALHPPNRLEVINLSDGSFDALARMPFGQAFLAPVWSSKLDQPQAAALLGPVGPDEYPIPNVLMLVTPGQSALPTLVAEAASDEVFASPVFCINGDLLYRAERHKAFRLLRQTPGDPPQTLLTFDQALHPLACP